MREIKFRAWDNDKKQMLYQEDNTTRNSSVMECQIAFDELGHCVFVRYYGEDSCFEIKNTELMQYTGLKDCNGIEIYEGDIVEYSVGVMEDTGVVEWGNRHSGFLIKHSYIEYPTKSLKTKYYSIPTSNNVEVVGDIYEKPRITGGDK